jgi:hypothetical protein
MRKDITICFRTDKTIRNSLEKMAEEGRRTISAVIETILYEHMKEKKILQGVGQERREYNRKQVSLPAFVMNAGSDAKEIQTGKVMDISLGGIRLSIPKGVQLSIATDPKTDEFHVIFTLPEVTQPINMKCKPQRVFEFGEDFHVGAAFVDSDFKSYQNLQKHLI